METNHERRRSKPARGGGVKSSPARSFGGRLLALRQKFGVSRQYVADEIGSTRENIRKLELDRTKSPGMETIKALARLYNVSVSDLIGE